MSQVGSDSSPSSSPSDGKDEKGANSNVNVTADTGAMLARALSIVMKDNLQYIVPEIGRPDVAYYKDDDLFAARMRKIVPKGLYELPHDSKQLKELYLAISTVISRLRVMQKDKDRDGVITIGMVKILESLGTLTAIQSTKLQKMINDEAWTPTVRNVDGIGLVSKAVIMLDDRISTISKIFFDARNRLIHEFAGGIDINDKEALALVTAAIVRDYNDRVIRHESAIVSDVDSKLLTSVSAEIMCELLYRCDVRLTGREFLMPMSNVFAAFDDGDRSMQETLSVSFFKKVSEDLNAGRDISSYATCFMAPPVVRTLVAKRVRGQMPLSKEDVIGVIRAVVR